MSGIATAVVASSVISGAVSSSASSKAAKAQTQAADQANATQQAQYDQTREDNLPWLNRGNAAGDRLSYLLGTGGTTGSSLLKSPDRATFTGAGGQVNEIGQAYRDILGRDADQEGLSYYNNLLASGRSLDSIRSEIAGSQEARGMASPANYQSSVAQGDKEYADALAAYQAQQSSASQNPAQGSDYGSLLRNFSQDDLNNDVVYQNGLQFGLDQGTKGINNQAAASGSMLSGATLKALTKYGNDYATTKTGDAYNRFQTNKNSNYNMLAGVAGTGQTANSLLASTGANTANQVSQNQLAAGNSRAASSIGSANALTSSISSGYNMYQNNQLVNALTNKSLGVSQLPGVSGWVSQG